MMDSLFRLSINSVGVAGPGAATKAMDRELSEVQCHNCLKFDYYRRTCPNRNKRQYQSGQTNNNPTDDSASGQPQKKNEGIEGGIWCSYDKTKTPLEADYRYQHNQDDDNPNVATV